jgi:Family of unknown function (DUF6159)
MFERFRRSWALTKASYAVLKADRELLVFPAISFIALCVVLFSFVIPLVTIRGLVNLDTGSVSPGGMVLTFVFYVVSYTVAFYFNTALVGAAMIRLNGGDPTIRDGLRVASSRIPQIIAYAVIAATVGMILRAISERMGFVGRIIIGFIGMAWSLLTFLVVPVLAAENIGPIAAIKRSSALLRKTWGEQLIGAGGIGAVVGLLLFVIIVIGMAATVALAGVSGYLAVVAIVVTVLVGGAIALVGSALGGIYTAALYQYATSGTSPAFDSTALSGAFRQKG